jgi:hypothetical protein
MLTAAARSRKSASTRAVPRTPGSSSAVSAAHEVAELALNFGAGGAVVGNPGRVGLPGAGLGEGLLVWPNGAPCARRRRWCTARAAGTRCRLMRRRRCRRRRVAGACRKVRQLVSGRRGAGPRRAAVRIRRMVPVPR